MPKIEIRPATPEEYEDVKLCIARSFADDPNNPGMPVFMKGQIQHEDYLWAVFADNRPVAGTMLVPFRLDIDGTQVQVMGLTGVGTDPDFRHQGLATRLLQSVHQYVQSLGFDGMVLHSAADMLYRKQNYEFAFCEWNGHFKTEEFFKDALINNEEILVDFLLPMDIDKQIIHKLNSIRNGSKSYKTRHVKILRDSNSFWRQLNNLLTLRGSMLAVLKEKSDIIGYAIFQTKEEKLSVTELIALNLNPKYISILLNGILEEFDKDFQEINFSLYTEDKELIEYINTRSGFIEKRYLTGNMACIFKPSEILLKFKNTLTNRLKSSANDINIEGLDHHLRFQITSEFTKETDSIDIIISEANLLVKTDIKSENITQDNNVSIFSFKWDEFTALMFGFIQFQDTSTADNTEDPSIHKIFDILFPSLEPVWDYFEKY